MNDGSLLSPKVHVVNADAFLWVDSATDVFDFIVVDFPDPTNYSLGKLYTTVFFAALGHHLSERGAFVVQSTSPMFARKSFWCIDETIKQAGYRTFPYHAYVPSFGEWGFVLAVAARVRAADDPARMDCDFWPPRTCRTCSTSRRTWHASRCRPTT